MTTTEHCPDCGSRLMIDRTAAVGVPTWDVAAQRVVERKVRVDAAFCTGCEFSLELRRVGL